MGLGWGAGLQGVGQRAARLGDQSVHVHADCCVCIYVGACDDQEGRRNAKEEDDDALRRMRVRGWRVGVYRGGRRARGGVGPERVHRWCGGRGGAAQRVARWHRDDVRARAVDLFAGIEVVLASAAVGTGDVEGKVAWGGWVGGGLGWGVG